MGGIRKKERKERILEEQRRQASASASASVAPSASPCPSGSTSASAAPSSSAAPSASPCPSGSMPASAAPSSAAPSASASAAPSASPHPSGSASVSDTHPSANVASTSTSVSPHPIEALSPHPIEAQPEVICFSVHYLEPSVALDFEAEPHTLSEIAVEKASALGIKVYAELLETRDTDLHAKPTYPTVLPSGRGLEVLQWSKIGHQPFVAVSPLKDSGVGFFQQRNQANEELRKCREVNDELVGCGLAALLDNQTPIQGALGCTKCDVLTGVVAGLNEKFTTYSVQMAKKLTNLEEESTKMAQKYTTLEVESTMQKKQVSSLLDMVEDLRKVRRRNVIEKARKKAVLDIGKALEDVDSWQKFFTDNEHAILELGISRQLLSLLRKGKKVLHKVVHEAPRASMADAILSLKEGSSERMQYEEAFKFAFDVNIHNFFSGDDDDEDE